MLETAASAIWGAAAPALFFAAGLAALAGTRFLPFTGLFRAVKFASARSGGDGISPARALLTSLGAVMGPGNIVGVAAAIRFGGAGAVFWMWLTGFAGMALRYVETYLAVKSRTDASSDPSSPDYAPGMTAVLRDAVGSRALAKYFALAGAVTALVMSAATGSAELAGALSPELPAWTVGAALSLILLAVLTGGAKRVERATPVAVGSATAVFVGCAVYVILCDLPAAGDAAARIFSSAFDLRAGFGALLGGAIRHGVAKGVYSNEAGMGSEPTIAAATSERDPERQALVSMLGPFLDTVVFCALTGVVCVMSGVTEPVSAVSDAFARAIPFGGFAADACLALLVLASQTGWYWYGEAFARCALGKKAVPWYRAVYIILPFLAAGLPVEPCLAASDLCTAAMAFPCLAAIIYLTARGGLKRPDVKAAVEVKNLSGRERKRA